MININSPIQQLSKPVSKKKEEKPEKKEPEKPKELPKEKKVKPPPTEEKPVKVKPVEAPPKEKKTTKKAEKEASKDVVMEEEKVEKPKTAKTKPVAEVAKPKETKEEKTKKTAEPPAKKSKPEPAQMEVDSDKEEVKDTGKADSERSKSRLGKRVHDTKDSKQQSSKRKKTEKGEKSVPADKRKIRHIEWQYGKHCSKDLWIGKKVKVKLPAKNKDDPAEYKFGKLIAIKENTKGEKVLFHIEFTDDKKKPKEWVNIKDTKVYIFGQILFLKHHHDSDQIEFIKKTYGWKGKEKKGIPIPVVELIDTNDENMKITPYEDSEEKIPIQYFYIDKAKKIRQENLYDYREYKDDDFEFIRDNLKNGEKIYAKITSYKKQYSQWIENYSKIDIDMNESLKPYCAKIVRVYKGDRN